MSIIVCWVELICKSGDITLTSWFSEKQLEKAASNVIPTNQVWEVVVIYPSEATSSIEYSVLMHFVACMPARLVLYLLLCWLSMWMARVRVLNVKFLFFTFLFQNCQLHYTFAFLFYGSQISRQLYLSFPFLVGQLGLAGFRVSFSW